MPVPLRNPALAAMEVATLARLFPGRFVPAAGHGVLSWMEQAGARAPSPMTLLREWVTATRSLLSGDVVTVSGQYVRLSGVVVNVLCAAGADSAERIEAELATSSQPLSSRAAVGSPEDVAETVRSFARAGATTVVLQPTAEDRSLLVITYIN